MIQQSLALGAVSFAVGLRLWLAPGRPRRPEPLVLVRVSDLEKPQTYSFDPNLPHRPWPSRLTLDAAARALLRKRKPRLLA